LTCSGSYVGHGGVAMPNGIVRSISFMDVLLSFYSSS
jgi:hypothetical protein